MAKVGAKPRYANVAAMQKEIDAYFEKCKGEILKDSDGETVYNIKTGEPVIVNAKPPTVTGLALALGFTSRRALLNYEEKTEFVHAITRAKARCGEYAEMRLYDRDGARGAEFSLRYNFKWDDEKDSGTLSQGYAGLPARVLGKAYADINRDIDERKHRFYDFKGGRGSLKSSYCGLKLIDQIMLNPSFCALAVRQLKDNLKDSVYSQILWAIDELGLADEFHCTKNPMEIRRKETGQIIYFRGAEDPMKIKSIKPPRGMYIGVVWIEEADQLHGAEAYRNILQSAMRGGDDTIVFRSYNTPRSQQHFINIEEREHNPARIIHHSHYKDAPPEWLGKGFYELAEHTKEVNETAYRHEYDGEAVGFGANVFENVTVREITDEEMAAFDRRYYGIDWGWYPDPTHFSEMHYDASQRKLYIYGELRRNRTSNEVMAGLLKKWRDSRITADSGGEGPKSIADFRSRGFDMRGAIKGPGSVDYSMKWLASLTEIVIDSRRCPFTASEFTQYEYERDKDGDVISGYPDSDNHAIDSVRYALEGIWKRRGQ